MGEFQPYVPASESLPELTVRAIILGLVLGALMTAANTYLGLYIGMTVSASIPAAVMSMLLLRMFRFKDVSILENNIVQTMTSAGESLAAGIIFTMPALLVMGREMDTLTTFIVAILGGILGTIFTITLRRVFIVEEALLYPEGIACEEVLVAGEKGGSQLIVILYALGLGALYGWMVKGFQLTQAKVEVAVEVVGVRIYSALDYSLSLVAVGWIVGLNIASYIFFGAVLGVFILTPIYGMTYGWPVDADLAHGFKTLWATHIRFVGVGCMVVGGLWTLIDMRKTISSGLKKALSSGLTDSEISTIRTEQDIPMNRAFIGLAVIAVLTFLFYWWKTGSLTLAIVGAIFLAITAFFFSAVAGYIAGVVGSSNSPVSGMTIATLMATSLVVWIVGGVFLNMEQDELMYATLIIASVVAVNAAIAGDVMQDLKTGHLVGATPWKQQTAELIGVIVGAVVAPLTLTVLNEAFRITPTYCAANPHPVSGCSNVLEAPQAEIIGTLIEGIFGGTVNTPMLGLGVVVAVLIIGSRWYLGKSGPTLPIMSIAIGMYLPFYLSSTIFLGGVLNHLVTRTAHLRVDGTLTGQPSEIAIKSGKELVSRGTLLSAGLIAGEALMGVVVAAFIVLASFSSLPRPDNWLPFLGTLGPVLSTVFFLWFFGVFTWLVTRSLPPAKRPFSLLFNWGAVVVDGARRIINKVMVP
ncbi:MAG: oligopeptide transporter, OPT family [Methanobacteriota archaeon]|jgi:putative OPT family oligopeptide transporter|nr:MAG: oligopeptide transporter, OPT family [Euryarchaeota archaeon]HIG20831.1 oligopeptide transporter, OPT family [Candidatus Poseidoniales archaeon]